MSLKYITVKEFSEMAEVTPQAVYKRIKTTLKPYAKKVDNKIMISVEGLKEFETQEQLEETHQTQEQSRESDTKELLNTINTLNQIINAQSLQLEEKERELTGLKESQKTEQAQEVETLNATLKELTEKTKILEEQLKNKEVELTEVKGWLSQSLRIAEQTNYITAQARLEVPKESTEIIPEDIQESAHSATQSDTEAPQTKPWYKRLFNRK